MGKPFVLGEVREMHDPRCGYGVKVRECDRPATHHVLWLSTNDASTACDEHMDYIRSNADIQYDVHTYEADCGMPGTLWQFAYDEETESYCVFPIPDDPSVLEEALIETHDLVLTAGGS